mmetsp:Transcript_22055/g.61211  ORF Transcript_22055/g.61211 Transcript_22055/m.61211 type:complete len:319 (-) Transcript_22055:257-1213(-)
MEWSTVQVRNRWMVDIGTWDPSSEEWTFLLSLLPSQEQKDVMRFRLPDDRKRTLVSRLMQRRCASVSLDIPFEKVLIKRTKGRKPFVANRVCRQHAPNFNFNVSHEGDYVVLASEPLCICGVDVAAPSQLRRRGKEQTIHEIHSIFRSSFTDNEWKLIFGAGVEDEQKQMFRRLWSLKEAFVKARGDGIAFDLGQADFCFDNSCWDGTARVVVHGVPLDKWKFFLHELPGGHWLSVARGPATDIVDAHGEFSATLTSMDIEHNIDQYQAAIEASEPGFCLLSIPSLVPIHRLQEFLDVSGVMLMRPDSESTCFCSSEE